MAQKFGRRRWRRPERLTLEHPPVRRRKDIGAPTQLTLEPILARKVSRRRLQALLVLFFALCAAEGAVGWAITGRLILVPLFAGLGVLYFVVGREWGDAWLRKALRARPWKSARLERLAGSESRSAAVQPPQVLVCPGDEPNAIALALRKRTVVLTEGSETVDELVLEGMLAHEVIHLRDGDAAVTSLYLVLAAAPELLLRRAGVGCLLAIPLWPVSLAMRLGRGIAMAPEREHRADVAAALLTRYPPGLADALESAGGGSCGLKAADGFWFVPRQASGETLQERAELVREM